MRYATYALVALVVPVVGALSGGPLEQTVWGSAFVVAATLGFRLVRGSGTNLSGRTVLSRVLSACAARARSCRDPHRLIALCERRVGNPVDAAARIRVKARSGARTYVLAFAVGYLWWIELDAWQARLGRVLAYRSLNGLALHTEQQRPGRHVVELSWPSCGELYEGTLFGPGADWLVGHLTAEQFARCQVRLPTAGDGP